MNCSNHNVVEVNEKYYRVPCGKCLACLSNKRNDWSFRLEQEHKGACGSAFITLTYHPMFVPEMGVTKRHVQLFMKRLRKRVGRKLRYYLVGEYGTENGRPHYHIILFNYDSFTDEEFVRKAWTLKGQPIGIVHVGKVTPASIRYCTKYIIQGCQSIPPGYSNKPFSLMSRAYGLGAMYLTDRMIAWHRDGDRNYTQLYGEKGRLPRFYKDKIWPLVKVKIPENSSQVELVRKWTIERERISSIASAQVIASQEENYRILKEAGYNPEKIQTEMRNAVMSRILEKVAYTQTL